MPRKHRRIRNDPNHPLSGPGGYVSEARATLYDKVGPGPHPCHWCATMLNWVVGVRGNSAGAIVADHLNEDPLDDRPNNLVVACGTCNAERWHMVGDHEEFIVRANGTRLRGERRTCEQCGGDFVTAEKKPGKGRFCSRSCARKAPRRAA